MCLGLNMSEYREDFIIYDKIEYDDYFFRVIKKC